MYCVRAHTTGHNACSFIHNKSMLMRIFVTVLMHVLLCPDLRGQPNDPPSFIKGVYGNPGALLTEGHSFRSLGVNAVFVRSISLDESLMRSAKQQGVRVYVEFPTLNGKGYVEEHPEAWPVNERGQKSPAADWFMGVCPTDPDFRSYRMTQLRSILSSFDVDGIWLDYLHWHAQFETPEPILPETCFCDRCIKQFANAQDLTVPEGETAYRAHWIRSNQDSSWREWRCGIVTNWVRDIGNEADALRPGVLLGLFYCAWYPDDFDGALTRIMGIDLKALAEIADVFSPMLFHSMMGRSVTWVKEYPAWLRSYVGPAPLIWPIVQAHNKPGMVSANEFRQVMINGSAPPSSGIMMFSEQSLLADDEKLLVLKLLYND